MDEHTFILLYKAMVCAHVEFANSVLCPFSQDSRLGEGVWVVGQGVFVCAGVSRL